MMAKHTHYTHYTYSFDMIILIKLLFSTCANDYTQLCIVCARDISCDDGVLCTLMGQKVGISVSFQKLFVQKFNT